MRQRKPDIFDCEHCVYFDPKHAKQGFGSCRISWQADSGGWPIVELTDWCGAGVMLLEDGELYSFYVPDVYESKEAEERKVH